MLGFGVVAFMGDNDTVRVLLRTLNSDFLNLDRWAKIARIAMTTRRGRDGDTVRSSSRTASHSRIKGHVFVQVARRILM